MEFLRKASVPNICNCILNTANKPAIVTTLTNIQPSQDS